MPTTTYGDGLTSTDVDELIAGHDAPLLLVFGADWCPPCHTLAPVLAGIVADHPGRLEVRKINVDDVPDLVVRWDIASAPTMLLFVDGELDLRLVGARPRAALLEAFAAHL